MLISQRWRVYILECADGTYYTGITVDLDRRIREHNSGKASKYTRGRLPVRVVWYQYCEDKSSALRTEILIKKFSRRQKKAIMSGRSLVSLILERLFSRAT